MSVDQHTAIGQLEQLWYTWSPVGIDDIDMGFRIRAASQGLQNYRSERVQDLDPYQRYSLPYGTDSMKVAPEQAPVCLALIKPENLSECILVNKVYTGEDGFGRRGAFFVHLLARLPANFSAHEAIKLWHSRFWWTADDLTKSTLLPEVPLYALRDELLSVGYWMQRANESSAILDYFPLLVQAFLEKHPYADAQDERRAGFFSSLIGWIRNLLSGKLDHDENESAEPKEKIYIAAADEDVALLIYALSCCLPAPFLNNLTFSTYERDVKAAPTEIVGTCWLGHTTLEARQDPRIRELLANRLDQGKLVINCYDPRPPAFDRHPLMYHRPLARRYAAHAYQYFKNHLTKEYQDTVRPGEGKQHSLVGPKPDYELLFLFEELFDRAEEFGERLDVDTYLRLYEEIVLHPEEVSDEKLDALITATSLKYVADKLSRPIYQQALIRKASNDYEWCQRLKQAIIRWQSAQPAKLKQALVQMTAQCIRFLVSLVNRGLSTAGMITTTPDEQRQFSTGIDLLLCLADTQQARPQRLLELLDALKGISGLYSFFQRNPQPYDFLMQSWTSHLPPEEKNVGRILSVLPPLFTEFGAFLALPLSATWKGVIIKKVLDDSNPDYRKRFVTEIAPHYHEGMKELITQLIGEARNGRLEEARNKQAWNLAGLIVHRLTLDGYEKKLALLFLLLDAAPEQYARTIRKLLENLAGERAAFLEHFGPRYLNESSTTDIMIGILSKLAEDDRQQPPDRQEKMSVLVSWLNAPELENWFRNPNNLAKVLGATKLSDEEVGVFLRGYGAKYCIHYPTPAILKQMLVRYAQFYSDWLRTIDIDSWLPHDAPAILAERAQFLYFLYEVPLPLHDQDIFYAWHTLVKLIEVPALLQAQERSSVVVENITTLLYSAKLAQSTQNQVIEKLALACLAGGSKGLPDLVKLCLSEMEPLHCVVLLYEIASYASTCIHKLDYDDILEACMRGASIFKDILTDDAAQRRYIRLFLDMLLQFADESAHRWLDERSQQWDTTVVAVWRDYQLERRHTVASQRLSSLQRGRLWWEQKTALCAVKRALKSKNDERVLKVYMEHLVTLQMRRRELPADWWQRVKLALRLLENDDSSRQQRDREQQLSLKKANRANPFTHVQLQWQRFTALLPFILAFRSRRTGKIAYRAMRQGYVLEQYRSTLPKDWQPQINIATGFFLACMEENRNSAHAGKAQEIIEAGEEIVAVNNAIIARRNAGLPTPRFTMHEQLRVREVELARKQQQLRWQDQLQELRVYFPL